MPPWNGIVWMPLVRGPQSIETFGLVTGDSKVQMMHEFFLSTAWYSFSTPLYRWHRLYKSQEAITFHLPSQLELESSTKTPKHQLIPLASQRCLKCRSKRCLINWHGSIHKWIKILAWKIPMKNAQTHSAKTSKVLKCVYSVEMCCLHTLNWCCGRVRKACGYLKLRQTILIQFRSAQHFQSQD